MGKTKEEVQRAFGLAEPPDDEFMALVSQLGEGEVISGVKRVPGVGYTAQELAEEFAEAVVADSVGELIAKARKETGRSLRDVGAAVGVSHGRVRELEHSSNVEIATLVRVAAAMGYGVKIVLEPSRESRPGTRRLTADLDFASQSV
ncbi:MAG: helix-turn-helix domain-containing protein [Longimicrobiaceae bacterium]